MKYWSFTTCLSALILVVVLARPSRAKVSLIEVKGTFDAVQFEDSHNLNTFSQLLSQPFTLMFSYDSDTPDSDFGALNRGTYIHTGPPTQMSLASGGATVASNSHQLFVQELTSEYIVEAVGGTVAGLLLPSAPSIEYGFALDHDVSPAAVDFFDPANTGNDPLPETPFFIGESLDNASLVFYFDTYTPDPLDPGNIMAGTYTDEELRGIVTSIRIIPEPTSLVLLGLGWLAIIVTRRIH